MDQHVKSLVDGAVAGNTIAREDAEALLATSTGTQEAAYIAWGARVISERAAHGYGQLFCQIGIDSTPCPENCVYCSYAECNGQVNHPDELSIDEVVDYARLYDRLGIHLLTIMCTSAYDFDKYCTVIEAVRAAVSDDLPIMANLGDIDEDRTRKLKSLGVQAAYHVVRINEGCITRIPPERRRKTIAAWKAAGVHLTSCVEPYYQEAKPSEVVDAMEGILESRPIEGRVMSLSPVPGSAFENMHGITLRKRGLVNDVFRLFVGEAIPFGGAESTVWVNAGPNPKGRVFAKDPKALAEEFALQKKLMVGDEWNVPDRPLSIWFEPPGTW